MRLLHTSDWHLGQCLHQFERSYEHGRFLDWLLEALVKEQIDALLIAGDIFDSANPPAAAQAQLYRFLTEARRHVPHLNIVVTAGNHDSPSRLEAPAPLLQLFEANVVGQVGRIEGEQDLNRLVVPLKNRLGETYAWCIAMPFLRTSDVPRIEDTTDPYMAGVQALYAKAFALARNKRQAGQAIIAIGHCHMTGGSISEMSERRIVIGGSEALSADIFDADITYVALGHLHLPQPVGGNPARRYSGSPLPMSFSEIHYPHQVVIVDLDAEQVSSIRELRVPRFVDLLRIPAKPGLLEDVVAELAALTLTERPEKEWPYLQVRVQLTQPEPSLRTQIEAAIVGKPVRLTGIETTYVRSGKEEIAPSLSVDELALLGPADFFQRLFVHRYGGQAPTELMNAFAELVNANEVSV